MAPVQIRNFQIHADTTVGNPVSYQMAFNSDNRCVIDDQFDASWMWQNANTPSNSIASGAEHCHNLCSMQPECRRAKYDSTSKCYFLLNTNNIPAGLTAGASTGGHAVDGHSKSMKCQGLNVYKLSLRRLSF